MTPETGYRGSNDYLLYYHNRFLSPLDAITLQKDGISDGSDAGICGQAGLLKKAACLTNFACTRS